MKNRQLTSGSAGPSPPDRTFTFSTSSISRGACWHLAANPYESPSSLKWASIWINGTPSPGTAKPGKSCFVSCERLWEGGSFRAERNLRLTDGRDISFNRGADINRRDFSSSALRAGERFDIRFARTEEVEKIQASVPARLADAEQNQVLSNSLLGGSR